MSFQKQILECPRRLWQWNQNYGSLHLLLLCPHLRTDKQGSTNYGSLMPATAVGSYWLARRS